MNYKDLNESIDPKEESNSFSLESEVETNQKNSQEFERVMQNATQKYDGYWDKNSPILRIILIILLVIIVVGVIYFTVSWFSMK